MEKTSGLGRGLNSLIPNRKSQIAAAPEDHSLATLTGRERVTEIPVDQITPNPHQPRDHFDAESLKELVDSIKEHGIIQPLIATELAADRFQLIAGERRWRAAKLIGLPTVPVIIRDVNEQKKLELALIENLQRKNLNVLEAAIAYQKLIDEFNLTQDQLARQLGKSRPVIANSLRILAATDEVKAAIRRGEISEGHARVLAGLPPADQKILLRKIIKDQLNVRETEKSGREVVVKKHLRKLAFDPEIKAKEESLQERLGTKVEIKKFGDSGQIIIKFFSLEELGEIFRKILD